MLSVRTDRADCLYACGEKAVFTVTVSDGAGAPVRTGSVRAVLDNFGPKRVSVSTFDLSGTNVFSVSGTLTEPGFLRLTLSGPGTAKKVWSVGFEPRRIRKGSPRPDDFDAYWSAAKAKLARDVPPDVRITPVPERSTAAFDFHRISFATFGRRVYGYLSVPKDASRAPYPVDFQVNAAGFGDWTNDMRARDDAICLRFSVYPFEMDRRWKARGLAAKYKEMGDALKARFGSRGYPQAGIAEGRETYFFHPAILGIDRAVDWVAARPDVDRTRIRYLGTSQGGGFGFYLCGLNKAFTRAAFVVPALTDVMGFRAGRDSSWPKLVEYSSPDPEKRAAAGKWAPYFDAGNFASRIRCPVRVVAGFADTTCPPCGVYAAFNEIASADKKVIHGIGRGHGGCAHLYAACEKWLRTGDDAVFGSSPAAGTRRRETKR